MESELKTEVLAHYQTFESIKLILPENISDRAVGFQKLVRRNIWKYVLTLEDTVIWGHFNKEKWVPKKSVNNVFVTKTILYFWAALYLILVGGDCSFSLLQCFKCTHSWLFMVLLPCVLHLRMFKTLTKKDWKYLKVALLVASQMIYCVLGLVGFT